MLRSTRGLLLLALILVSGAVAITYYRQRQTQEKQAPRPPKNLPLNLEAAASTWVWRKDQATHGIVEVRAKRFRQLKAPSLVEIEDVEVLIYRKEGAEYDRIRSAKAKFDDEKGTLFSDGPVDITMGLPAQGPPQGRRMEIHSTGVTYEAKTGKAYTDRAATFQFDQGDGRCAGASYDPNAGELVMKSQVEIDWRGRGETSQPMKIEAGELTYKERESSVLLRPWARLTRGTSVLEGNDTVVTLKDGAIDKVQAAAAHGVNSEPDRQVQYSAGQLVMTFTPKGEVEKIVGEPDARLVSVSPSAKTTVTSRRVDLEFDTSTGASQLRQALTAGNTVIEAAPVPRPGAQPPETRIVRSDRVALHMRPGGSELESVETLTPGRMEFFPNRPDQRRRTLDADRMFIQYGANNAIEWFKATNAATRTEAAPVPKGAKPGDPLLTWSKDLRADFDPKTGQLARLEQWGDFRYQEGERRARAGRAILEQARDRITLEGSARVWDSSGSTAANHILLDQKSGDVWADGNVVSNRMPDRQGRSSSMLTNDQPLQAQADRMETTGRNQKIHYQGHAIAWQGANRIWADDIDIDRSSRQLSASGHVRTQLEEKSDAQPAAKAAPAPTFVTVDAATLLYAEANRLAHYTGGVHLVRPGMDVRADQMRAYLNDANADSSLDHVIADGHVRIVRREPDRALEGTGEHAEYYAKEERIFLTGGKPVLVDSARGTTRGQELTYYVNNDKLLVDGVEKDPVATRIIRRH
jgi:lipopolysaccharide export system protein LptA